MEHAHPDRLSQRHLQGEAHGQDQRAGALDDKCARQHQLKKPQHAVQLVEGHGLLQDQPLPQADLFPEHEEHHRNQRHVSQAASLDQKQQHYLAEGRPLGIGVHQGQPGHAHRGGGGEQGGQEAAALPVRGGRRQDHEDRAHCDDRQEERH